MDQQQQQHAAMRRSILDQRAGRLFNQCGEAEADNVVLQETNAALSALVEALRAENAQLSASLNEQKGKNADLQGRIAAVEQQVNDLRATGAAGLRLVGQDDTEAA